ncbi:MAG: glycosyltransferase family 4 protein [Eubacteriales bacterium]|nr:glycosyltransferase family 4 protein [Eubacteriales bacterium]
MRIGLFTDCYYPQVNGVVTSVMLLKESLEELGHDVFVITVKIPNYDGSEEKNIIRVPSVPFAKWREFRVGIPTFFHRSFYQIQSLNLDVIHTHTEFSLGLLGRFIAKTFRLPITHTYHTMYEDYTHYVSNLGQPMVKSLMQISSKFYVQGYDVVIVPSKKTQSALRSYGVTNDIVILPTGINVKQFERLDRENETVKTLLEHYGYDKNAKVLLSLGRISKEKSIDFLIESMPELIQKDSNIRLLIVGDGPYKVFLEEMVSKLNLSQYIRFAGRIPFNEVINYYSLADIFVNASKTETQGLTIFEAMASNLPVIVFDDDNVADVVIDHESGRLFTDREGYIQAVMDDFASPFETKAMAKKGKEIVDSLSKESFALNMQDIYQKIIQLKKESKSDISFFPWEE